MPQSRRRGLLSRPAACRGQPPVAHAAATAPPSLSAQARIAAGERKEAIGRSMAGRLAREGEGRYGMERYREGMQSRGVTPRSACLFKRGCAKTLFQRRSPLCGGGAAGAESGAELELPVCRACSQFYRRQDVYSPRVVISVTSPPATPDSVPFEGAKRPIRSVLHVAAVTVYAFSIEGAACLSAAMPMPSGVGARACLAGGSREAGSAACARLRIAQRAPVWRVNFSPAFWRQRLYAARLLIRPAAAQIQEKA